MWAEPPLSYVFGRSARFAAVGLVLGGVLAYRFVGWPCLAAIATAAAFLANHYWWKYELLARDPRKGELDHDGQRHGHWLWRFPDGTIGRDAEFQHGQLHGTDRWYFPDGSRYQ